MPVFNHKYAYNCLLGMFILVYDTAKLTKKHSFKIIESLGEKNSLQIIDIHVARERKKNVEIDTGHRVK